MKLFMAVLFATLALNGVLSLPGKWVKINTNTKLLFTRNRYNVLYLHTYIPTYICEQYLLHYICTFIYKRNWAHTYVPFSSLTIQLINGIVPYLWHTNVQTDESSFPFLSLILSMWVNALNSFVFYCWRKPFTFNFFFHFISFLMRMLKLTAYDFAFVVLKVNKF